MDYVAMEQYWIWLSSIEGLSAKKFYQLISEYEDARNVWSNVGPEMRYIGKQAYANLLAARKESYLFSLFPKFDKLGINVITRLSDNYPKSLLEIYDPPPTLYVRGTADLSAEKAFAVVGSRHPTHDGRRAATEIAGGLAQKGVTVVSGMARGIDTAAHRGALEKGGTTIAVLGCGVDVCYPPESESLMQSIIDQGGAIVSEFVPGTKPLPRNFPLRNRIISGLCPGTLIVEAGKGSGAMITANLALEQGRDVFVVPGSIYSSLSYEPNRLLLEGAYPVLSEWEILEHYRWAERSGGGTAQQMAMLTEEELSVVEPLRAEELSFDELVTLSGIQSGKLNSLLTMLELRGIIDKVPGGYYRAR